jgi:hypothetical protein
VSSLRNFKSIADEAMNDINVSEQLKDKTLKQCTKKKHVNMGRLLIPAACFVLILAFVNKSGVLPFKAQTENKEKAEINIMLSSGGEAGTQEDTGKTPDEIKSWQLDTMEEARMKFGEYFMMPSFIPDGYKIGSIYVSGFVEDAASKSTLTYTSEGRSFLIIEEKSPFEGGIENFKPVEINGVKGYMKPGTSDTGEKVENFDNEIHWFLNGVHYSVSGQITENDALNVARSMK